MVQPHVASAFVLVFLCILNTVYPHVVLCAIWHTSGKSGVTSNRVFVLAFIIVMYCILVGYIILTRNKHNSQAEDAIKIYLTQSEFVDDEK